MTGIPSGSPLPSGGSLPAAVRPGGSGGSEGQIDEFATEYEVIPGKEKVIARLKKLAKSAETIYLAPDPDREGEAIAAHLAEELGGERVDGQKLKKGSAAVNIRRVTFNEFTKKAVQEIGRA